MPKRQETPVKKWPTVTATDIADALGVTAVYVRKLEREGWFKKSARGQFSTFDVLRGVVNFYKDESRRSSKSASQSRVSDRRADEIELRIIERSKGLVEEARAEAITIIDMVVGGLRADLMAVPARITSDLEQRRKIEVAHDDVLRAAAKRAEDCAKGMDAGEGPADAGGEVDG